MDLVWRRDRRGVPLFATSPMLFLLPRPWTYAGILEGVSMSGKEERWLRARSMSAALAAVMVALHVAVVISLDTLIAESR